MACKRATRLICPHIDNATHLSKLQDLMGRHNYSAALGKGMYGELSAEGAIQNSTIDAIKLETVKDNKQ